MKKKKKACVGLTYADGDVSGPLIVVLAVYRPLPDELKSKLALEAQNVSV